MTAQATPEQMERARRIAADALTRREPNWLPGVKAGIYDQIIAGDADGEAIVQGPLTAIQQQAEIKAHSEVLVEALQWALDELNGRTRYDEDVADQQIENCYLHAENALTAFREYQKGRSDG